MEGVALEGVAVDGTGEIEFRLATYTESDGKCFGVGFRCDGGGVSMYWSGIVDYKYK